MVVGTGEHERPELFRGAADLRPVAMAQALFTRMYGVHQPILSMTSTGPMVRIRAMGTKKHISVVAIVPMKLLMEWLSAIRSEA